MTRAAESKAASLRPGHEVLILFVKAPTPGEVKTRLVPVWSEAEAAELYRCLVLDTLAVVHRLPDIRLVIAYAPDRRFPDLSWLPIQVPVVRQRGHSLGQRLIHAFAWAFGQGARSVVVMGSDAPELTRGWVRRAFVALRDSEAVIGPTADGGYQLIGLSRPCPALFTRMPWSTPALLSATLRTMSRLRLRFQCLPTTWDLDTPGDVRRYLRDSRPARRRTRTLHYLKRHDPTP